MGAYGLHDFALRDHCAAAHRCRGLMLIVIGMLIGMNLMLLAVWLMAIHWFFVWLNGR